MDLSGSQFQDRKLLHRDPCCRIYCHNGPLQYLGLLHSQVQDSHLRLRQVGQVLLQLIFSYFLSKFAVAKLACFEILYVFAIWCHLIILSLDN